MWLHRREHWSSQRLLPLPQLSARLFPRGGGSLESKIHGGGSLESKKTKLHSLDSLQSQPQWLYFENSKKSPSFRACCRRCEDHARPATLGRSSRVIRVAKYTEWKFIPKNKSPSLIASARPAAGYHNAARCTKCHWDAVRPVEACLDLDAAPRSAPSFPPFSKISAAMSSVEPETASVACYHHQHKTRTQIIYPGLSIEQRRLCRRRLSQVPTNTPSRTRTASAFTTENLKCFFRANRARGRTAGIPSASQAG